MTIVIAWIRKVGDCEELIFTSDSRLSGDGRNFDACPKILTLPRTDCAIAYAGYTGHAFPMIVQFQRAIDSHAPALRGSLDVKSLLTHLRKIFDKMSTMIQKSSHVAADIDTFPDATFVFGGYSWIRKRFELWTIVYRKGGKQFAAHPAQWIEYSSEAGRCLMRKTKPPKRETTITAKICFAGDQAKQAQDLLISKLNSKELEPQKWMGLGWEPFEIVRDMLRDPNRSETIGGAPQVVKVYQYMQSTCLGVFWPDQKAGEIYLQGRPCLGYERIDNWILDPDSLRTELFKSDDAQLVEALDNDENGPET